jgi:glycerol uptake operon antiterminator
MKKIMEILENNPIIAGVKDDLGLAKVLKSECAVVFILYGNIMTIKDIVQQIKDHDKLAFVHVDLLEGASHKEIVLDFIKTHTHADGIISTRATLIRAAKNHGFITVHRVFLVDSMSFHSLPKMLEQSTPDLIEIMPGGMPKVIGWVREKISIPIISGGLVCEKEDVLNALNAGAIAISSTSPEVWAM